MNSNRTDIQKILDSNIPKESVSERQGGGKTLSYLETWYVIDRMNQVFGQGNWSYSTIELTKVFEGQVKQGFGDKEIDVYSVSYTAKVGVFALIDGKPTQFTDVGYGDGTDKKNPGKAHELASKEAVSDGMKRACKNFGRSMGLALYDKTQQFVGATQSTPKRETLVTNTVGIDSKQTKPISTTTKDLITGAFKVLEAQNQITAEGFKVEFLKDRGLSTIPEKDLPEIYNTMKKRFPTLNGKGA